MTGWCFTQTAIMEALHAAGQPTAATLTADEPRKRVGNEETGKTAATPFTDKSKVELLDKASQCLEKKRARSSRGAIRSFAGLVPGFLLKSPGDSKQGNKRRFHTREDARPRGSDAPAEPELGKRLRKQLEEWLPGGAPPWQEWKGRRQGIVEMEMAVEMIEESKAYGAALCHDARMLQVACHSHDCTSTCVKNQKKKDAPEESLRVHKTPLCRFHFFRTLRLAVETTGGWVTKAFRRRGKALVPEARVAATDDHGELGRAQVVRQHPFTSSTTPGGLVLTRVNTDCQYINRCPPPDAGDGAQRPSSPSAPTAPAAGAQMPDVDEAERMGHAHQQRCNPSAPKLSSKVAQRLGSGLAWASAWRARVRAAAGSAACAADHPGSRTQSRREARPSVRTWFSGFRVSLTEKKRCVLRCIGEAWRAAHNCDFYITEYQSKQMQTLRSVMDQYATGMKRLKAEEDATDAANAAGAGEGLGDPYITGCPYITMYQSKYNRYDKLFAERALVLEMVKNDWSALEHAAAEFCADREIVLLAVKNDWRALKYAAVELCAELQVRRLVILSRVLRLRAVNPTVPSSPLVGLLCILPDDCFHRIVHCI